MNPIRPSLSVLCAAFFVAAPALANVDVCKLPSVGRVPTRVYPNRGDSPLFGAAYQRLGDPRKGTIVFIPGGPGQATIDDLDPATMDQDFPSPKGAEVIQIEPRGVGCNQAELANYPVEIYSTDSFAEDALSIIRGLGLKDYVIYGASYGTMVATTLAAKIEHTRDVPKPRAVVLTGLVGKPWPIGHTQDEDFAREWEHYKATAPASAQAGLHLLIDQENALGYGSGQWAGFIRYNISNGLMFTSATPKHLLTSRLEKIGAGDPAALADLRKFMGTPKPGPKPVVNSELFMQIACTELSPAPEHTLSLEHGRFVVTYGKTNRCAGRALTRAWYAKDYPFTAPIFYFQGAHDPASPIWGMDAHFAAERNAPRYALVATYGGHGALYTSYLQCKDALWASILAQGAGFRRAAATCAAPSSVRIAMPVDRNAF